MTEFVECKTCADKPGSPVLCYSCLSNRKTIGELKTQVAELKSVIYFIDVELRDDEPTLVEWARLKAKETL